jgi:hypothetical protein
MKMLFEFTYLGDRYRHTKSDFCGEVVEENNPVPWRPGAVKLKLESASGERREFSLTELQEID